ncbi:hypothetical protein CLOP_g11634 [Closterium sp. NIES-67]|nr:hypothetical protein CLOP_g11634 [Closterium sp. NIES-67]
MFMADRTAVAPPSSSPSPYRDPPLARCCPHAQADITSLPPPPPIWRRDPTAHHDSSDGRHDSPLRFEHSTYIADFPPSSLRNTEPGSPFAGALGEGLRHSAQPAPVARYSSAVSAACRLFCVQCAAILVPCLCCAALLIPPPLPSASPAASRATPHRQGVCRSRPNGDCGGKGGKGEACGSVAAGRDPGGKRGDGGSSAGAGGREGAPGVADAAAAAAPVRVGAVASGDGVSPPAEGACPPLPLPLSPVIAPYALAHSSHQQCGAGGSEEALSALATGTHSVDARAREARGVGSQSVDARAAQDTGGGGAGALVEGSRAMSCGRCGVALLHPFWHPQHPSAASAAATAAEIETDAYNVNGGAPSAAAAVAAARAYVRSAGASSSANTCVGDYQSPWDSWRDLLGVWPAQELPLTVLARVHATNWSRRSHLLLLVASYRALSAKVRLLPPCRRLSGTSLSRTLHLIA